MDEKSADLHKAIHLYSVPGWRNGAISGVPLRLLWAYEHDFAAILPSFLKGLAPSAWSLWLEQRIAGWRSGRSEGESKSLSGGYVATDLLLLTQRTSRPVPG